MFRIMMNCSLYSVIAGIAITSACAQQLGGPWLLCAPQVVPGSCAVVCGQQSCADQPSDVAKCTFTQVGSYSSVQDACNASHNSDNARFCIGETLGECLALPPLHSDRHSLRRPN
jgi:hypothetical protein